MNSEEMVWIQAKLVVKFEIIFLWKAMLEMCIHLVSIHLLCYNARNSHTAMHKYDADKVYINLSRSNNKFL